MCSFGQKLETSKWVFQYKNQLNFIKNQLTIDTINGISRVSGTTSTSLCDSNGNFISIITGDSCFDGNFKLLPNGKIRIDDIYENRPNGSSIFFSLRKNNLIHVFHTLDKKIPHSYYYLCHFIIDLNLNGGMGDMVLQNRYRIQPVQIENLVTPVLQPNGEDYWIVARKFHSDTLNPVRWSNSAREIP